MNAPVGALPLLPAHRDRRGWLIAFGIIEILIACFFLLLVFMMAVVAPNVSKPPGQPELPRAMFYAVSIFYLVPAAIFAVGGIGSILTKNWARIYMIVLSSLWLAFGVLGTVMMAIVMPLVFRQQEAILQQSGAVGAGQLPPNFETVMLAVILGFQIVLMVLLPLIFLLFYTRKSVKATCQGLLGATAIPAVPAIAVPSTAVSSVATVSALPATTSGPKALPVPVILAIIWFGIIAISSLGTAFLFPLVILFGFKIQGMEARLILLVFAAANTFCVWSFYKLRIAGWWTAIAFSGFYVLSGLVTLIRVNAATFLSFYDDIYRQMGVDPQQAKIFMSVPQILTVSQWFGWLIVVALFAFVLFIKRYFPNASINK
jgi:hypothetical protein